MDGEGMSADTSILVFFQGMNHCVVSAVRTLAYGTEPWTQC